MQDEKAQENPLPSEGISRLMALEAEVARLSAKLDGQTQGSQASVSVAEVCY